MHRDKGNGSRFVTIRELYELAAKIDQRIGRVEKGLILLGVLVASPKLGGPSAPQVLTALAERIT